MLGPAIYLSRCLPEALTCTYGRVFKLRILPESVVMDVTFDHKRVALEVVRCRWPIISITWTTLTRRVFISTFSRTTSSC